MQQNSEHFPLSKDLNSRGTAYTDDSTIIAPLWKEVHRRLLQSVSVTVFSLGKCKISGMSCNPSIFSIALNLVMTFIKTATVFLSKIPERKESTNLETN